MFKDARSKSIIFTAHCILNQNSISDGTATHPGHMNEILDLLSSSDIGIVQMPCPELHCLGLDRGNPEGCRSPVVEENTRIREELGSSSSKIKIDQLVQHIVLQISEYLKYGFNIKGIVGINRSPSCGVDTTSENNMEVEGKGVFIKALQQELKKKNIQIEFTGIKAPEKEQSVRKVKDLLNMK